MRMRMHMHKLFNLLVHACTQFLLYLFIGFVNVSNVHGRKVTTRSTPFIVISLLFFRLKNVSHISITIYNYMLMYYGWRRALFEIISNTILV